MNRARTAIVYDFDGTLARGNIQEHGFLPGLHQDIPAFWDDVKARARANDADEILIYMWRMLEAARASNQPITREVLEQHGRAVPYFNGVATWFDRINKFAQGRDLDVEHYVVSSGNYEIIRGCSIFPHFRMVYASRYIFDEKGEAVWPGVAINYTTKTQFLFRINKGVHNFWDNERVNQWMPLAERPIPFTRMIFIGDGETDIPSMKMVRHQGGHSVAVFDPEKFPEESYQNKVYRLVAEDRVHFVAPADYSEGSQLDVTIKGILGRYAREAGYREPHIP
jgi:phosphoserine phosphatase